MSTEIYTLMCNDPRIQASLKWEPKVGDEYGITIGSKNSWLILDRQDLYLARKSVLKESGYFWHPRCEDLVESLKGQLIRIYNYDQTDGTSRYKVELHRRGRSWEAFKGYTFVETLLLAFAWTVGWKWEDGKWERR